MRLTAEQKYQATRERYATYNNNPLNNIVMKIETRSGKLYAVDYSRGRYFLMEFDYKGYRYIANYGTCDEVEIAMNLLKAV